MTNELSIQYISSLIENPHSITEGDTGSIASFVQSYPYFLPARYFTALDDHKRSAFSPEMRTTMEPYIGNWLLFCDFLEAGVSGRNRQPRDFQSGVETEQVIIEKEEPKI